MENVTADRNIKPQWFIAALVLEVVLQPLAKA
jgi:hypothetical protein